MPANTTPIFTITPNIGVGGAVLGPTANTATDGTGSAVYLIFTAGAQGSLVQEVSLKPIGSPNATVCRLFYCNDTGTFTPGTTNTAANSVLLTEVSTSAITLSQTSTTPRSVLTIQQALPPNTKLFVSFGTSTGTSTNGYAVVAFGGDY